MSPLTYDQLVAELFPRLTGGIRWGLDRTLRILESAGNPHNSFRSVHVGGTNGKGSVAAHIESVLRHDGRRVGLYSSPHLCTFRERIRIDGHAIAEDALVRAAMRLWPTIQQEGPSFFEATTAIAFAAFADAAIDVAVIEVGLGGRLDATNVITPDVVALTNVSLDHIQLLGPTLHDVAREKAGIIKPGVPLVTADTGVGAEVFAETAAALGAPLHRVQVTDVRATPQHTSFNVITRTWGELALRTPLLGAHQAVNAALGVSALDVLTDRPRLDALVQGIAAVHWPGRLQRADIVGVTWLFDVAHNVAGVEALVAAIADLALPRPVIALVGVLGDKDWGNMLSPLHAAADRLILTAPPTAPAERRWNPQEALQAAPSDRAETVDDFTAALERAQALAGPEGTVVVTGSFHTVGDAMAAFGLCVERSDIQVARPAFI